MARTNKIVSNSISKKIRLLVIFILLTITQNALTKTEAAAANPDPARYADDIERFRVWDKKNSFPEQALLFAGSSSAVGWMSHEAFPQYPVINRGFGGSHISDVLYYINDVILKYRPAAIVFYCGDNDIAGEKSPVQVFNDYLTFIKTIRGSLGETPVIYIPIKPSNARWKMWPKMEQTNMLIKNYSEKTPSLYYIDTATPMLGNDGKPDPDLFLKDGLHLNAEGYKLWNSILAPLLDKVLK